MTTSEPDAVEDQGAPALGERVADVDSVVSEQRLTDEEERSLERYRQQVGSGKYRERLEGATKDYLARVEFTPGEIVPWKDLLKDMLYPEYGAPATFLRYLRASDREYPSFFSSLRWDDDCLIGYLDGDLDFVAVACASARLMRWVDNGESGNLADRGSDD